MFFLEVSLVVNQHGPWSAKRAGTVLLPGADGRHDSRPEARSQLALLEVRCHALERSIRLKTSHHQLERGTHTGDASPGPVGFLVGAQRLVDCNGQDSRNENRHFHQAANLSQIYHKAVAPGYITPRGNLGIVLVSWIQGPLKKKQTLKNPTYLLASQ